MPDLKKITKLRSDELYVRSSQALAAFAERHGWSSLTRLPNERELIALQDSQRIARKLLSADQWFEHFRCRAEPRFFAGFEEKNATISQLRRSFATAESEILEQANRILDGHIDLLGLSDLRFTQPIDWHLEPVSGKRTPLVHWSKLDYLDPNLAGDKKIVWELNRHQYFTTLGQAYWLTDDERYAQTFVAHLESWMDQNPPKLGINWASSLEVAFRSISWLWGFYFFKDSPSFSPETFRRALSFLYLHARHLETYLSTYFSPNTHLTGEALGLFYLGLLLPEFKDAVRWRQTGKDILLKQLPIHVRPDGVYFEQSSYYHRYTTDFYTHFLILSRANGEVVTSELRNKLSSLLDHLMYITQPDGTTPLFGDDDAGRLVMLARDPANDFRATLSTGAALFERPDYKFVAADPAEETLWLLGVDGLKKFEQLTAKAPEKQSVAFENGGYYVMRDGWTEKANYLLFDCGPHGTDNCGHAHADALSFQLAANGRTVLVDPGTFTYTGSKEMRNWFRSAQAHNTLTVNGRSSSVPAGPFSWKSIARCQALAWISRDRFDYVTGAHDGYLSQPQPAMHRRSILFLKQDYWVIRDHLKSEGEHDFDLWFHFDPGCAPLIETAGDDAFIAEATGDEGLNINAFSENGRWRREDGWASHAYGQKEASRVYVFSGRLGGARNAVSLLVPRSTRSRWQVSEIEAIGGQAFQIANEIWLDIVMIRTGERIETARLASDFEWTWARFSRADTSVPEQLVLINGRTLQLEGRQLLGAAQQIEYLVACNVEGQFQIDSDKRIFECQLPIADFEATFAGDFRRKE
ncbi:MAG: alginate lyase family protein [Pyrinomonadaceae bacterium]